MPKQKPKTRRTARFFAALLGIVLLACLIVRTGPSAVLHQVHVIGWGLALIIVLGGVNYFIRTYAWRLTFVSDTSRLSLGACLPFGWDRRPQVISVLLARYSAMLCGCLCCDV